MAIDSQAGVAENNRQQQEKAHGLLYQLIQQALTTAGKVTEVRLRIPFHGNKLGSPKGSIEKEG